MWKVRKEGEERLSVHLTEELEGEESNSKRLEEAKEPETRRV